MQSSENAALLCLSVPVALDDEIADFLRSHPALISGFTSVSANGMGPNSIFGSIMEQVQGKSRRQLFMSEAPLGKITSLLTLLQDAYQVQIFIIGLPRFYKAGVCDETIIFFSHTGHSDADCAVFLCCRRKYL
jgi:hypothetical protein